MADRAQHRNLAFLWFTSWRMLWRDWRGGELGILAIGLVIALTSITAVGFFTDRIERGLQLQSAELIGADLVITSSRPDVFDHIKDARAQAFSVAITQQFRSVVLGNDRPQLVEVKAVTSDYPLRGVLRVSDTPFGADEATTGIPARGDIWVEARMLQLLDLGVGDRVSLGAADFTIRKVLRYEPDRAGDMFSVAPRVLMNRADVDATDLIGTGALVNYRVLIAGAPDRVRFYQDDLAFSLRQGEQVLTVEEGRPELNTALEKARQFLGLAALISVLLAGVAVATVAWRYTNRHLDTSAMLRCLGAAQRTEDRDLQAEALEERHHLGGEPRGAAGDPSVLLAPAAALAVVVDQRGDQRDDLRDPRIASPQRGQQGLRRLGTKHCHSLRPNSLSRRLGCLHLVGGRTMVA